MISQIDQILMERLKNKFSLQLLFRGSRDGFKDAKFHELCDNQGPLLFLIKTGKDILIGGFSSIPWKSGSGEWTVDPKCVVFSLTRNKTYQRHNDDSNVYFGSGHGPYIGLGGLAIIDKKLYGFPNCSPFKIGVNGAGEQELVE